MGRRGRREGSKERRKERRKEGMKGGREGWRRKGREGREGKEIGDRILYNTTAGGKNRHGHFHPLHSTSGVYNFWAYGRRIFIHHWR